MRKVSTLFGLASGAFAVIPGITVLTKNIGVPPNASSALFAGTIETVGVLTLLIMWINKEHIAHLSAGRVTRLATCGLAVFFVSLLSYLFLFDYYVVEVPAAKSLFFPMWPAGELRADLQKFGSRTEVIHQWGRDDVYKEIQESSRTALIITTLIFLLVYQLIFASLTFSFGILGIKGSAEKKADEAIVSGHTHA